VGERSFSKLNLVREELRSTMSQKRLNSLSLMSIEHELLSSLDYGNVIEDIANEKARKKPLKSTYLIIDKTISIHTMFFMIIILDFI